MCSAIRPKQNPLDHALPALELVKVSRRFGVLTGLRDVSLVLGDGEIISLVGHSGCGKSTLLRIVAGIEKLDSGIVRLDGVEVAVPGASVPPEQRNIGFVFQDYALFPHLTVEQNIYFGLRRGRRTASSAAAADLVGKLGLADMLRRYPHTLSGGEQQRVAIARALAPGARLLLMDEPFSNLDRSLRAQVRHDTLALLRSLGTTGIIVTHDPEEALSCGDRVVLMRAGGIIQQGTADEIYENPVSPYAAEFFTAYNKVPGVVRQGRLETVLGRLPLRCELAEGTSAVAYIRPQDIELTSLGAGPAGTIVERVLMGEIEQVSIVVAGLPDVLIARSTRRLGAVGARVGIDLGSRPILAFVAADAT